MASVIAGMAPAVARGAGEPTAAQRPDAGRVDDPAQIREAARRFEALFIDMMMRAMREAGGGDDKLFGSSSVSSYQSMMDSQLSESLAGSRGFGIADLLERGLSGVAAPVPPTSPPGPRYAEWQYPEAAVMHAAPAPLVTPDKMSPVPEALHEPGNPEAFVRQLHPLALRHAPDLGVAPEVLLAQAALETGWGAHVMPGGNGRSSHNLFGIKAAAGWDGPRTAHRTLEFRDGVAQPRVEPFRVYDGFDAAFADYVSLVKGSNRYAEAVARAGDPEGYLRALQAAGYATDPRYADKILSILERSALQDGMAAVSPAPVVADRAESVG